MEYVIVLLIIIILVLSFGIFNLIRKNEALDNELRDADEFFESLYTSLKNAYRRMVDIDRIGSFEADDESGYIFKEIKSALEELNEIYELDGEETEE